MGIVLVGTWLQSSSVATDPNYNRPVVVYQSSDTPSTDLQQPQKITKQFRPWFLKLDQVTTHQSIVGSHLPVSGVGFDTIDYNGYTNYNSTPSQFAINGLTINLVPWPYVTVVLPVFGVYQIGCHIDFGKIAHATMLLLGIEKNGNSLTEASQSGYADGTISNNLEDFNLSTTVTDVFNPGDIINCSVMADDLAGAHVITFAGAQMTVRFLGSN